MLKYVSFWSSIHPGSKANCSAEFVPFQRVTVHCVLTVLSLEGLVILRVSALILLVIFDACLPSMLVEVWDTVLLVGFAVCHCLHDVISVSVWIFLLVDLIWSKNVIVLSGEVDELRLLRVLLCLEETMLLPWLSVGSVGFCLSFMWGQSGWHLIRDHHVWASFRVQAFAVEYSSFCVDGLG